MLEVSGVSVRIEGSEILHSLDLSVEEGELVALLGANGAGKSTCLRALAGLTRTSSGTIRFRGEEMQRLEPHERVRRGVVLAPEEKHLFAASTVRWNLLLGAFLHRGDSSRVRRSLDRVFDLFPILRDRSAQLAGTLSGGEQRMLVIGRALMSRPSLLLLDEPSFGLAPLVVRDVFAAVAEIRKMGVSVLLAEQNAEAALSLANRGHVLAEGRVVLSGPASELMDDPVVRRSYLGVQSLDDIT
jgi:branched-chain amino acid transport system ATP-binding protein